MSKEILLFTVGLLVFLSPLAGVPTAWKDVALFVLGGLVMLVALVCRLQKRQRTRSTDKDTLHVEHRPLRAQDTDVTPV